jgi:tripartite ATP-independent transporter DctM subunit
MNSVGTLWLFCLTFVICADVAGRYLFDAPIQGAAEVVGFSVVAALFLAFPNTLHVGRFTRVDVLIERLEARRPGAAALLGVLFHLSGAAVFGLIAWGTWPRFQSAWVSDEITGTPGVFTFPVWPFFGVIVFGAAATCVEFLIQLGQAARRAARPGWAVLGALLAAALAVASIASSDLTNIQIGLACIVLLVLLLYSGMPIGVVMIVVGFAGIWLLRGDPELAIRALSRSSSEYLKNYFFGVVPLYVLMGLLVSVSDVGRDAFDVARWALRGLRGGLGVATVAANALFASVTGSSIASAAVFTRIATPEMLRFGYTPRFAVGVVAGTSVLGMLIPPSLLLIVYGFIAEESVGALFLAAIVPGLILAALMALAIVLMATFMPRYVGGQETQQEAPLEDVRSAALKLLPIVLLIVVVLGGIYGGVFTPTESAAAGALGALAIAIARRKLTWRSLWGTMVETGYVTVSVLFLLLAARIFGQMLAMSNLPQQMSAFVAEAQLGLYGFTIAFVVLVLLLGTILDSVSIMVITLPFAVPVVKALGGDLLWFGIVATVAVETGLLTPPFGISCYVVKSTLDDARITLNQIFAGALPFVLVMLLMLALLVFVPAVSLVFK